jgi:transcriptional regulator with XRE-family HTH domain
VQPAALDYTDPHSNNQGMEKMLAENFIANVNAILERKRISRANFARQMEVTAGYVSNVLNGRHDPGLKVIESWAAALGVDPTSLLREPRAKAKSKKIA